MSGSEAEGHYATRRSDRLIDSVVVDTETHVFIRAWPIATSPQMSLVDPYTRTEHSGDLLVAEMDRIGVDRTVLIGYDGYDFVDFMRRFGSDPGDFMGGRGYTRGWAQRYPDRFIYVTTLRPPAAWPSLRILEEDLRLGAAGVKLFPAYLRLRPDSAEIRTVFDVLRDFGAAAVFGMEDSAPPETPSLDECYDGIATLAADYPDVPIQLNHGANAMPGTDPFRHLAAVANDHPTVLISTSVLGGVLMDWADDWRYPFPTYLRHLESFAEAISPAQLAWATDWPWFEGSVKYPQLFQSIVDHATFFDAAALRAYCGQNAARHWRLSDAPSPAQKQPGESDAT